VARSSHDFGEFFHTLHAQVQTRLGDYAFIVALYDKSTESVSIPFMYEEGQVDKVEPFPLGEGLTSILIRTRQPLLLTEDVERKAAALGAKTLGKPARTWMGLDAYQEGDRW
jgi:hypothetical protein